MLMKLCKLSRHWFSAADDKIVEMLSSSGCWKHRQHKKDGQLYRCLIWPLHDLFVHAACP